MNLNNIQLTPDLLCQLYKDNLVGLPSSVPQAPIPVSYLGANARNILILVTNADDEATTRQQVVFLTNVLAACKLGLEDVALVNAGDPSFVSLDKTAEQLKPVKVLLFDISPASLGLPIHFPHYQLQPFKGCTYLAAPSLSILERDLTQKKQFWNCLKTLFSLQ